jgi:hypothetical protein
MMLAVQQSVLMKMISTPEGWQSTVVNGVKMISYDGKRHALLTQIVRSVITNCAYVTSALFLRDCVA